ncbi:hypothetical protein [Nocardia farcinica]|uniref:hypothetical protein n=1 Tax=Nocardia farcinica TaxID=37329 RepID=UPI0024542EFA|nr:hypothetical protein [Nocardia farcinica]
MDVIEWSPLAGPGAGQQRADSLHLCGKQVSTHMRVVRSLVAGAFIAGAASVLAVLGAGSANAVAVTPLPGGVQVDLSHADTKWVADNNFGRVIGSLPHPSAPSFGEALDAAAELSSQYPTGRVTLTVFGPLDQLNGTMLALQ